MGGGRRCSGAVVGASAAAPELFFFLNNFFEKNFIPLASSLLPLFKSTTTFLKTRTKIPRSTKRHSSFLKKTTSFFFSFVFCSAVIVVFGSLLLWFRFAVIVLFGFVLIVWVSCVYAVRLGSWCGGSVLCVVVLFCAWWFCFVRVFGF